MPSKKTQELEVSSSLMDMIAAMPEVVADTPEEIQNRIFWRILSAESLEEMLAPQGTISAEDLLGVPVRFNDVHFNESTYGEGKEFYAIADGIVDGKGVVISCGARTVMMMLFKAKTEGWLPFTATFERSPTPTAAGFYPIWLAPVPAQAVKPEPEKEEPF